MEEMAPSHQTILPNNPGQQNKWNLPAGLKGPRGEGRSHEALGVGVCDGSECLFCQVGSVYAYYVPFPGSGLVLRK